MLIATKTLVLAVSARGSLVSVITTAFLHLSPKTFCYNKNMPYKVGKKGSYGCAGYPAVKDDGTVMGCHKTKQAAAAQIYAINQSEGKIEEKDVVSNDGGIGIKNPQPWPGTEMPEKERRVRKMEIKEGDFVMGETTEGMVHGVVEHIMWEGGTLGTPGSEYALESMPPQNPAMSVRLYEEEDDQWMPTAYSIGMMYSDAVVVDMESHEMGEEDDMQYMSKAETYSPSAGMKSAARRALKWKEDGKATGAGTPVGWGRASDIVAGRSMSLSVVRRMYSFFSRHEVDKKGKDFYNTSNPSNGRIMWDAWGGDAGFSWSRAIVRRNEEKMLFADFGKDYTRAQRLSEVFKADSVRVGQMVSWNSSGGRASGKVKRIVTSGSYKVPGTDVTVNGTPEDPAVVITLYRDGKETDVTVAHRRSTLRAS